MKEEVTVTMPRELAERWIEDAECAHENTRRRMAACIHKENADRWLPQLARNEQRIQCLKKALEP